MDRCVKILPKQVSSASTSEEQIFAEREALQDAQNEFGANVRLRLICIMAGVVYFAALK